MLHFYESLNVVKMIANQHTQIVNLINPMYGNGILVIISVISRNVPIDSNKYIASLLSIFLGTTVSA